MSDERYVRICLECDSGQEIEVKWAGDEGWDTCPACGTIEGYTTEVTETDWEAMQ